MNNMPGFFHEYPRAPLPEHPPAPPSPPQRYPYAGGVPGGFPGAVPPSITQRIPELQTLLPKVQQALRMAQTAAPYIKQYYPLVRQLPVFLKMLSAAPPSSGSASSKHAEPYSQEEKQEWIEDEDKGTTPAPKLYV
ncbi:YqfQ-like protein [Salibacterium halotolerans]|uniref:YqfQ-like protein n=2 Tax=Salibacterium halotolerans TaxID=1884432 RepID=A0A1I5NJ27_9BACI|nr:YqfQ-like protein [Salibacterium halotolerans]